MKEIRLTVLTAVALTAVAYVPALAAESTAPFTNNHYVLQKVIKMNGYHSEAPTVVVVDKGSHFTYVLQHQGDIIVRVLTISDAIGSKDKPTPSGKYSVAKKEMDPVWIPTAELAKKIHKKKVEPYSKTHENPLGVAAIFLNKDELALHGTNEPKLIRKSASHGCIRHSNSDISKLYGMVRVGTPVYIVDHFAGTVLQESDFGERKETAKAKSEAN